MVQAEWDQGTFHESVEPCSEIPRTEYKTADSGDRRLDRRPDKVHENAHEDIEQSAHDGDESCPAKEGKHLRELDPVIFIMEPCGPKTHKDPAEHAHLQGLDPRNHSTCSLF